jgi:signal transduction histidine kinase
VQAEELAVSRERNELARNIHDSVGHALTAVNVQLRVAQTMLDADPGVTKEAISKAQKLASGGLADIRDSVSALRTSPLRNRALDVAIADLLADETSAGLPVSLQVEGPPRELPYATQLAFFRSVQEGLTNVRKHTSASKVGVTLDYRTAGVVVLRIVDDGGGASSFHGGFGLLGLRERAVLLGGELAMSNRPGVGVQLEMRLPG